MPRGVHVVGLGTSWPLARGAWRPPFLLPDTMQASLALLIIYRGPGFLAVVWFGSSPTLPHPVSKLSLFLSHPVCRLSNLLTGEGGGGGEGARLYVGEKAWSSINHSIISVLLNTVTDKTSRQQVISLNFVTIFYFTFVGPLWRWFWAWYLFYKYLGH